MLSFDAHVQLTVRASNFYLAALRHVMSDDVAKTVGCNIVVITITITTGDLVRRLL